MLKIISVPHYSHPVERLSTTWQGGTSDDYTKLEATLVSLPIGLFYRHKNVQTNGNIFIYKILLIVASKHYSCF